MAGRSTRGVRMSSKSRENSPVADTATQKRLFVDENSDMAVDSDNDSKVNDSQFSPDWTAKDVHNWVQYCKRQRLFTAKTADFVLAQNFNGRALLTFRDDVKSGKMKLACSKSDRANFLAALQNIIPEESKKQKSKKRSIENGG